MGSSLAHALAREAPNDFGGRRPRFGMWLASALLLCAATTACSHYAYRPGLVSLPALPTAAKPMASLAVIGAIDPAPWGSVSVRQSDGFCDCREVVTSVRQALRDALVASKLFERVALATPNSPPASYAQVSAKISELELVNDWGTGVNARAILQVRVVLMPDNVTALETSVEATAATTIPGLEAMSAGIQDVLNATANRLATGVTERLLATTEVAAVGSIQGDRSSPATPAGLPKVGSVAVLPMRSKGDAKQSVASVLDDILLTVLQDLGGGKLRVVGKSDIDAMLGFEKTKDAIGCDSVACAAEIAGALGVESIISPTVGTLGSKYMLTLVWIDQQRGVVLKRHTEPLGTSVETFDAGVRQAVTAMLGASRGSP